MPPAFIRGPSVYLRSRRLFEIGILYQDYMSRLHTSSPSIILLEFIYWYSNQTAFYKSSSNQNRWNKRRVRYRVNLFKINVTFLQACTSIKDHLEGLSSVFQQFLESFHKVAFLRTDHHLVLNCLNKTFAVEQLTVHFLRVSRLIEKIRYLSFGAMPNSSEQNQFFF